MIRIIKYVSIVALALLLTACTGNQETDISCELNTDDFATVENNPLGFEFVYNNSIEEIDYTNFFVNGNMNDYLVDDTNVDWAMPDTYEINVSKESCTTTFSFDVTIYPTVTFDSRYYVEMGSTLEVSDLVLNYLVFELNNYELTVDTTYFNNSVQGVYNVDLLLHHEGVLLTTEAIEVEVKDSESPVIILRQYEVIIEQGYDIDLESFIYNVTDNVSRRLIDKVRINDKSFSNLIQGEYDIEYSVEDDEDNTGTAVLHVTVLPSVKPTITLNGAETVFVKLGTEYIESEELISYEDYRPEDDEFYKGEVFYQRIGDVNINEVGIYRIEYKVTDSAEQTNSVYREVIVYDELNFLDSKLFGGNGGFEEIVKTETLSDGSVVAIGYTSVSEDSSLINTGDLSTYFTYPRTAFIVKFNAINEVEWIHVINAYEESQYPHYSLLNDLMVDEDDNIYAVGSYHGNYDENVSSIDVDTSYFSHLVNSDLFVTKLTKDGLEEYTTLHGTTGQDHLFSADLAVVNGELMIYAIGYIGAEDNDFEDDELENDTYGKGIFSFTAEDGELDEFQIVDEQLLIMNDILINPNNNQLIIVGSFWDYPLLMQTSTNLFDKNNVTKYYDDLEEGEFYQVIEDQNSDGYIAYGYTDVFDMFWETDYNITQSGYVVRFDYNPNGVGDESKFDILNSVILKGFSETKSVVGESWVTNAAFDENGNLYVVGTTANAFDENLEYISMGGLKEFSDINERIVYSGSDGYMAVVDLDNETYEYIERYGSTSNDNINCIEIIGNRMFLVGSTEANLDSDHLGNVNLRVKDDWGFDILVYNKIDITMLVAEMLITEASFTYYGATEDINVLVTSLNEYFDLDTDYTVSVSENQLILFDGATEISSIAIVVE